MGVVNTKPLLVGLTGGIGSGKSTVAQFLVDCGAVLIDADALSRALTAPGGAAMPAIAAQFGADFVGTDGGLLRERMRALVFEQPQRKRELEAIVHPLVGQQIQARTAQAVQAGARCIVYDVPLLVESAHWRMRVRRVLVVDCEPLTQVQRVVARSGLTAEAVQAIMATQASRAQRLAAADDVIFNQGLSLGELRARVALLAARFGL